MARQDFIQKLLPGALEASRRTGLDPRLIIAQAAQETGWGRSAPGNNYFGIKSHGKAGGQSFKTHEYVNGKRVNITDSFRSYASPSDSALGYADFLQNNKRYREMLAAPDLETQVAALGRSGYATDPNYANSVLAIAKSIDIGGVPAQPSPSSPAGGARAASEIQPPSPVVPGSFAPSGGSTAPSSGSPFSIDPIAAELASGQKPITPADRLGAAFKDLGQQIDQMAMPRASAHPGGPSPQQANALLAFMNNPTVTDLLLKRRLPGALA